MSKLPLLFLVPAMTAAAPPGINEDESKVPPYTLPDPLTCTDGTKVADARTWREKRRPELLRLFESEVYGHTPLGQPPEMKCLVASEKKDARGGKATRREIDILFFGREGPRMRLLLYLPNKATGRSPVFLGLNFGGNYTTSAEPDLPLASGWVPNNKDQGITENKAQESARGSQTGRWQIDYALDHGYGVATAYYGDIDPDFHDGFKNGVHAVTGVPKPGEWGSIGAWAWGLSRALDCLEKEPGVDPKKVIVMGHSRLGKTALWAGAQDERFALVISNDSGCGGAALSSRWFGETVARINTSFPHWFTSGYKAYNDREESCPVDQHELIALIAPRPVLVNSATQDSWADPRGEFLGAAGAASVYKLLGTDGISQTEWPAPDTLLTSRIGYYLRPGPHDVTLKDWQAYVTFADKHLGTGASGG